MNELTKVVPLWPTPESVADRWHAARVRILLQLTYGRPAARRRARILAAGQGARR
ncbi:hypothetical protein ACFXO9_31535 [Nocardia tengchongensis]|uniref:hypothetical protein n=1 Tax=Nocardia tengchongensis TaxID=2055889 RepID=UPI0036829E03